MQAAYGENLKVVGSSNSVGSWDAGAAPEMRWADGHIWALDLNLPEHAVFEYKIVHMHCDGTLWESCQNRQARIFAGEECLDSPQQLLTRQANGSAFPYADTAPLPCKGR